MSVTFFFFKRIRTAIDYLFRHGVAVQERKPDHGKDIPEITPQDEAR
jgi:hypothetical protein